MEDFVTFEQAMKLKDLGFDWDCHAYYDKRRQDGVIDRALKFQNYNYDNDYMNSVSAPTIYQAQKWLREVQNIHIEIKYTSNPQYEPWVGKVVVIENYPKVNTIINTDTCDTYEEALSEGIDNALGLLKEKIK